MGALADTPAVLVVGPRQVGNSRNGSSAGPSSGSASPSRACSTRAGTLYESFVIGELLKAAGWAETRVSARHWRDRAGREVDPLFERRDGDVAAVECKLSSTVGDDDFRQLAYLRDQLGDRFAAGAVVYTGANTLRFGDRLWAVPVGCLWAG